MHAVNHAKMLPITMLDAKEQAAIREAQVYSLSRAQEVFTLVLSDETDATEKIANFLLLGNLSEMRRRYMLDTAGETDVALLGTDEIGGQTAYRKELARLKTDPLAQLPFIGKIYEGFQLAVVITEARYLYAENSQEARRQVGIMLGLADTWNGIRTLLHKAGLLDAIAVLRAAQLRQPALIPEVHRVRRTEIGNIFDRTTHDSPLTPKLTEISPSISDLIAKHVPVGTIIKILRVQHGMSIKEIAREMRGHKESHTKGLATPTVSSWESGTAAIPMDRMREFGGIFELPDEEIELLIAAQEQERKR